MWILFEENGGRQLLNTGACSRIIVVDTEIRFYGTEREWPDHMLWVLEFKSYEDAISVHKDIEIAIFNGEKALLIDYKFD